MYTLVEFICPSAHYYSLKFRLRRISINHRFQQIAYNAYISNSLQLDVYYFHMLFLINDIKIVFK